MAEEMAKVAKDIQAPKGVARLSAAKSPQAAKLLRRSSASTVSPNVAGDLEVMEEDDEDLPDPKAAFRAANDAHQAVPAGQYCPLGSAKPKVCPAGKTSPAGCRSAKECA